MTLLSSVLVMRDTSVGGPLCAIGERSARPFPREVIIALHAQGGDVDQLVPLSQAVAPDFRLIALEGPRSVTAYTVQERDNFTGYAWFYGEGSDVQELARFGHALACLEDIVVQVMRERTEQPPPWVLGCGQGAVMALALAEVMPEFLSGVMSICGSRARTPLWSPRARRLERLPILLGYDSQDACVTRSRVERDAAELRGCGAEVTLHEMPGACADPLAASDIVKRWLDEQVEGRR